MIIFLCADNTILKLNITLLAFMVLISVLLIIILSLLLKYILKRFRKKPSSHRNTDIASEEDRESGISSPHTRIIRARLDHDMPYALLSTVAPPSYRDTLLADQIVQESLASENTPDYEEVAAEGDTDSNSSEQSNRYLLLTEESSDSTDTPRNDMVA